jgi:hypothetical protein
MVEDEKKTEEETKVDDTEGQTRKARRFADGTEDDTEGQVLHKRGIDEPDDTEGQAKR